LRVLIAELPHCVPGRVCVFAVSGDGADALFGDVVGRGGVEIGPTALAVIPPQNDDWVATGTYSCTVPGALSVFVGSERADLRIACG